MHTDVRSSCSGIRYIMGATFCNFEFCNLGRVGPDATRSETVVAGLKSFIAFLQPEIKCVYYTRATRMLNPAVVTTRL